MLQTMKYLGRAALLSSYILATSFMAGCNPYESPKKIEKEPVKQEQVCSVDSLVEQNYSASESSVIFTINEPEPQIQSESPTNHPYLENIQTPTQQAVLPEIPPIIKTDSLEGKITKTSEYQTSEDVTNPGSVSDPNMFCAWNYIQSSGEFTGEGTLYLRNDGIESRNKFEWKVADLLTLTAPGGWSHTYDSATDLVTLTGTALTQGNNIIVPFTFNQTNKELALGNLNYYGGDTSGVLNNVRYVKDVQAQPTSKGTIFKFS